MAVDAPELSRYLPPVPPRGCGDGWDWMDTLAGTEWAPCGSWGAYGWNLGQWPYVIVAVCRVRLPADAPERADGQRETWGVVTYVEGDREVHAYDNRHDFIIAVDEVAAFYWRLGQSRGPVDFPEFGPVRREHSGPYLDAVT